MSTLVERFWSDQDMACPPTYYGGFKETRVKSFGEASRRLSNPADGSWTGSQCTIEVADHDRSLRVALASSTDRYWTTAPWAIRMISRPDRALLLPAFPVFVGPPIEVHPRSPLSVEIVLGDVVSEGLLNDQFPIPWRQIKDSFINEPTFQISDKLEVERPEPIIYGSHRRVPESDKASPQGFQYVPIYLGIEDGKHVWMVAGHACSDIPNVLVWITDEATGVTTSASMIGDFAWEIPHSSAPPYEDRVSTTFDTVRRYTLIRADVGNEDADSVVAGTRTLTCFVDGIEATGEGTGSVITDQFDQYEHFLTNFVVHRGPESYHSGAWLTNPTWSLYDGPVPIIDSYSFAVAKTVGLARLPFVVGNTDPPGYIGAAIIGAGSGDRSSARRWIADWNRSCGCRFGVTRYGQLRIVMTSPTAAIKAAAPVYTDAYEILKDSFSTTMEWSELATRIPFKGDFEHQSGQYRTADVAEWPLDSLEKYGRVMVGREREYPFAPGITQLYHRARMDVMQTSDPPRFVAFKNAMGPLSAHDLGDFIQYQHFGVVGTDPGEPRLAQIEAITVAAGQRTIEVLARDVEDLIDFDAAPAAYPDVANDRCATATVVTQLPWTPVDVHQDTTANTTDTSIGGSPIAWSGTQAYHAAWFQFTPWANGTLFLTTVHTDYDTQLAVFTGACGALTEVEYNDDDGALSTSVLEFAVTADTVYHILAAGVGAADAGALTFGLYFTEP